MTTRDQGWWRCSHESVVHFRVYDGDHVLWWSSFMNVNTKVYTRWGVSTMHHCVEWKCARAVPIWMLVELLYRGEYDSPMWMCCVDMNLVGVLLPYWIRFTKMDVLCRYESCWWYCTMCTIVNMIHQCGRAVSMWILLLFLSHVYHSEYDSPMWMCCVNMNLVGVLVPCVP